MTHASLFTGIGACELAARRMGFLNIYGHGIEVPDGWALSSVWAEGHLCKHKADKKQTDNGTERKQL